VRPLTLLIACGIVLSAALLMVTGLVVDYLRNQTLVSSEAGIAQLDAVLSEAAARCFHTVDLVLGDVADRLRVAEAASPAEAAHEMASVDVSVLLARRIEALPTMAGVAVIGADGTVLSRAGEWPLHEENVAIRDYFTTLRIDPTLDLSIGAPIAAGSGSSVIPVARKLRDAADGFAGVVVGTVGVRNFDGFYRTVALETDATIALVRRDGVVLTQYPSAGGSTTEAVAGPQLTATLRDGGQRVVQSGRGETSGWRISAVHSLSQYPVAVVVSRDGDQALIGWSRPAAIFGAFTVCGIATIVLMVFLIGRQIHTHNVLATIRAEKIEMEHARLVAEAELLKKERLSVLGQFTASVANELRNPLSAIRNTLFTMREIATSSGLVLDRPIARIQRSIARCDSIIGDLREYIRTPELSRVTISFDDWLHELLAEHNLPPAVMLVEECNAGDAVVRVDADRIRHVVINLIDNAAQALTEMPPGSGPLRITVRSAIVGNSLELAVADTGPGIARQNLARIFEPLFSTKSFGAGLGLATVKQIVVQHGGTISIASEPGEGTCVTIRLPLEQTLKTAA
jgi:signal transduction histidine kinase